MSFTNRVLSVAELDRRGWHRYPLRRRRSGKGRIVCAKGGCPIIWRDTYFDGGGSRVAHERCVPADPRTEREP